MILQIQNYCLITSTTLDLIIIFALILKIRPTTHIDLNIALFFHYFSFHHWKWGSIKLMNSNWNSPDLMELSHQDTRVIFVCLSFKVHCKEMSLSKVLNEWVKGRVPTLGKVRCCPHSFFSLLSFSIFPFSFTYILFLSYNHFFITFP